MARYLVDEDLPRSLALRLREAGLDAVDVRDVGLRGASDEDVLARAVQEARAVLTADVGFGNILRFPLGEHSGIVLVRLPDEIGVSDLISAVLAALSSLSDESLAGSVVTINANRIRIRKNYS